MLGKLEDENALMRTLILRTAMSIKENPDMPRDEYLASLRGITHAVAWMESFYRTQKFVMDSETSLETAMEELKFLPFEQD